MGEIFKGRWIEIVLNWNTRETLSAGCALHMRCALDSAQPVRVVGRDSNELGVWIGCSQFDKCSRVKHIKEVFLYLFTLSKLPKAEILITMFSNFHSRTVHRGIIKVFTPNDAQVFDMYMSYRWRESYNTVRFVTSSQRGLTCVGAECGKEGGGPYIRRGAD